MFVLISQADEVDAAQLSAQTGGGHEMIIDIIAVDRQLARFVSEAQTERGSGQNPPGPQIGDGKAIAIIIPVRDYLKTGGEGSAESMPPPPDVPVSPGHRGLEGQVPLVVLTGTEFQVHIIGFSLCQGQKHIRPERVGRVLHRRQGNITEKSGGV